MYEVIEHPFGKFTKHILWNEDTNESVSVIPEFGGAVHSLALRRDDVLHELFECDPDDTSLVNSPYYRGAKLLPWPNRIRDGRYRFEEMEYNVPINEKDRNTALHGLLYNKPLVVVGNKAGAEKAVLLLAHRFEGADDGYPFKLDVEIEYRLDAAGFTCTTTARNVGYATLPFADGWHPYFTLGKPIDKLRLDIPVEETFGVDKQMIPVVKERFKFDGRLSGVEFDTGFIVSGKGMSRLIDTETGLTVVLWQDESYPYLQVYTHPSRKSISIEPMSAATNAFNSGEGLTALRPGERWQGKYGVFLE